MPPSRAKSFSLVADGILDCIQTDVHIGSAIHAGHSLSLKKYRAIWDTGATGSVITQKVVDEGGYKPTGMVVCHGVQGEHTTETFLVSIGLPNGVGFNSIRVTKGILMGDVDVLIGMDIIIQGDLALTHYNGKTCFSFRYPSLEKIDFVKTAPPGMTIDPKPAPVRPPEKYPGTPRNALCPCGSGEKFKKCCLGKPA